MTAGKSNYQRRRSSAPPNVDIVEHVNGSFGRWQLRTILLIFLCKIPTAWFMACIIYTAPYPQRGELVCHPATWNGSHTAQAHGSMLHSRNTDRLFSVQVCNAYAQSLSQNFVRHYGQTWNATSAQLMLPCEKVEHNTEYKSLITQFDLICSRRVLVAVTQSFHALGALLGGLLAYQALRYISPRRLMLLGMLGQIFCGNLTGLVDTYQLHIYFRCLTSVCCTIMYTAGHQILMDITSGKARILVVTLSELFWSIGLVLLPAISIYFDNWSHLYVAISSSLIVLVWLHRWITDAPRWLLRHQQVEPALRNLLESATHNNRMVPLTMDVQLTVYAAEMSAEPKISYCQIWDKETKRRQLIYIHFIWGCAQVLYNIILLMIRSLGEAQVHVNTAALGFAEMMGVFVGLYFILYTRRYWRWTGNLMIVAGLCTYLVWLLPDSDRNSRRVGLELIFWMLLKFANSASIAVLTTCTGEMVSPAKRILLMLSVVSFGRLFLVFSPLLSTLTVVHRLLPITIIATIGWVYGLIMRFLNRFYWNTEQVQVGQVPTPNTYRRNSAVIMRRCSTASSDVSGYSNELLRNFEQTVAVSIADLWHINFNTIHECDSMKELSETVEKPHSSMHSI
ncbi:LOW QUALITY PROTEIN: solute carrier family 22 member 19 [Drosophila albomicans]|uniref:LOW QUALITY PROTEIN: solute carrier family 22 member 19 n=1 Tax=Drosophila albomicans TaxID=7291 RepID=A0A6P8XUD6_DROAB|nr:LOW QUALITY PROTEIN: solute carrier family 22 member 19 [Drosophila albomicans]